MISFPPIFSDKNPFSYANLRVALRQVRDRAGAAQLALLAVHCLKFFVLKHTLRFYGKKYFFLRPSPFLFGSGVWSELHVWGREREGEGRGECRREGGISATTAAASLLPP